MESFITGYRLQEDDLNISFYSSDFYYPPGLTYLFTPYYVSYELAFFNSDGRIVPFGSRDRIPVPKGSGVFRANFIIGYNWATGDYQITWKYKVSSTSDTETIVDIFQVTGDTETNPFVLSYCRKDLPGVFVVLPEAFDLPASFTVVP